MRTHQLNFYVVIFSLLGLLFACLSAALIVTTHVSSHRITFIALTSNSDSELQSWFRNIDVPAEANKKIRGNRKLVSDDGKSGSSQVDTEQDTSLVLPSEGPTVIIGQIFPINPEKEKGVKVQQNSNVDTIKTHTVPSLMVGLASVIIVCAAILYFHDLRDRFRGGQVQTNDNKSEGENIEGDTSAGSTSHEGSTYWVNTPSTALPPMASPDQEDISLSRVSTLTASMMESAGVSQPWSFSVDEKLQTIDSSSQVTELSDEHLVPQDTSLKTLMKSDYSSSSNDGDDEEEDSLLGEKCLSEQLYETFEGSPRPSFEYTPEKQEERDVPCEEPDDDSSARAGPVQLDEFLSQIQCNEMSNKAFVVRDIYFCPNGSKSSIGVKVKGDDGDGYPKIVEVDNASPLAGRVFVGDVILSLNDVDGIGFSSEEILSLLGAGNMVKITLRSIQPELLGSDVSTSSIDMNELVDVEEI